MAMVVAQGMEIGLHLVVGDSCDEELTRDEILHRETRLTSGSGSASTVQDERAGDDCSIKDDEE